MFFFFLFCFLFLSPYPPLRTVELTEVGLFSRDDDGIAIDFVKEGVYTESLTLTTVFDHSVIWNWIVHFAF